MPSPDGIFLYEAGTIVVNLRTDPFPIFCAEILGAEGEEDVVFLVYHLFFAGENLLQCFRPFRCVICMRNKAAQFVTYFIVYAPHHIVWSIDIIFGLEEGIEQIPFLAEMLTEEPKFLQLGLPCHHRNLFCQKSVNHSDVGEDGIVFQMQDIERMAGLIHECYGGRVHTLLFKSLLTCRAMKEGGMHVAHALDVPDRHAAADERLLRIHYFGSINVAEVFHKVFSYALQVFTFGEPPHITLQKLFAGHRGIDFRSGFSLRRFLF